MKSVFLFLFITFSSFNSNAQLGDLFRKLGDTIDAVTKQKKVEEVNNEEGSKENKSEDSSEVFVKKEGQTIAQINSDAYIYCAWKERKKERKYITLEEVYPELENIQVYKNSIVDEVLTLDDYKLIEKRKCNERMYFIEGKLIPSTKIKELEIKYNKNITGDIKNILVGRWSSPIVCRVVTNRKGGTYISLNNNQDFIIQNYDPTTSTLTNETIINRFEKFSVNGKNLIKLSGQFSDDKDKNIKDERIWDITNIADNKFLSIERKTNNQQTIKDGIELNSGEKIAITEKCSTQNNNQIIGEVPKLDNTKSNNINKNSFGVKGIELGGSIPKGFICNSDKYFEATKSKTCSGETTILEVPYYAKITVIDEKVELVFLYDNIYEKEMRIVGGRTSINKELWDREERYGKLSTINDFSIYMNDLIKNIIERIGDSKKTPKIVIKEIKSIESVSGSIAVNLMNSTNNINIFKNKLAKGEKLNSEEMTLYEKNKEFVNAANIITRALNSQCKNCKSSIHDFSWDMGDYLINVRTTLPESKEDPFMFYAVYINYSTKDASKKLEKINALRKKLEEEELKGINDFNKENEVLKNENRKKDF